MVQNQILTCPFTLTVTNLSCTILQQFHRNFSDGVHCLSVTSRYRLSFGTDDKKIDTFSQYVFRGQKIKRCNSAMVPPILQNNQIFWAFYAVRQWVNCEVLTFNNKTQVSVDFRLLSGLRTAHSSKKSL